VTGALEQPTLVVANPRSRNGATGRRWAEVEHRLRGALGEVEVAFTEGPRDAERLAREGALAGVRRVLVAGGDGTLSEVATGLLAADLADGVEIGLLPLGTGGDFVRGLGMPRDLEGALRCIAAGRTRAVDAGRLHYRGVGGGPAVSYFVNVASFGISGLVNELVNRSTKALGGTVSFLLGTIRGILRYRGGEVRIRVDGELVYEGELVLAAGANGSRFGGGMRIAPEARVDDGLFDVVIIPQLRMTALLRKLPKLYAGTHLADPITTFCRGRVIEADEEPGSVRIELDGEPLGTLPARFEMLPAALRILVPA
jgi:YegS/Rv2252/BmrU family lipid kinase